MQVFQLISLCVSLMLDAVNAAVITKTPTALPLKDPFYKAPAGWRNKKPGTILRTRQFAPNTTAITGVSAVYQLLYRSTNSLGEPNAAAVHLWVPANNRQPEKHLAYSLAYDSSYANCEPTYIVQKGVDAQYDPLGGTEQQAVQSAINLGYYVSTSDYEGQKGAYTNGLQSGRALLDSVRAVRNSHASTGVSQQVRSVLWGYSGGALASEWASELHKNYAPDAKVVGAALGGLTPDISSVALTVNKTPFVGLVPGGIWGLAAQYKNLTDYINRVLKPEKKADFAKADTQCLNANIIQFFNQDIFSYSDRGRNILTDPVPASIVNKVGIMGRHGVPDFPVLAYKGAKDQISKVEDTDKLVTGLCKKGAKIEYIRDMNADHLNMDDRAFGNALAFVRNALDSGIGPTACHTSITSLPT